MTLHVIGRNRQIHEKSELNYLNEHSTSTSSPTTDPSPPQPAALRQPSILGTPARKATSPAQLSPVQPTRLNTATLITNTQFTNRGVHDRPLLIPTPFCFTSPLIYPSATLPPHPAHPRHRASRKNDTMNGWLVFIIVLLLLLSISYFGWYFYARWNASRNGLPAPSMNPMIALSSRASTGASNYPGPAPTGIKGWFDAQVHKFKNRNNRYTTGSGYEESGYAAGQSGRGRGAQNRLDPDEAWSSRVGDEAYYEEQELGLHEPASSHANPFTNSAYTQQSTADPARGRSRTRESYDEHLDVQNPASRNPFADDNAQSSLRGVSPRPLGEQDTSYRGGAGAPKHAKAGSLDSMDDSPTESRRSVFREGL